MTISEIAKLAGVSSAAVSRYFNNGYVSDAKREAIRKVVEETGYRPSLQAQTLRTKKTKMIGVVLPKIDSNASGQVVKGILQKLNETDYQMLLADTMNDPKKELEYLDTFDDKRVDGVILSGTVFTPAHKKKFAEMNIPLVIVGQQLDGFNCIYYDDMNAEWALTKHVLENGCKKIGFIGVMKTDRAVGEERYRGFIKALEEAGIPEQADNYVIGNFTMDSGYEKMGELLEKCPGLDGVICATDRIALGAMRYLKEHGIRIPEDVRVAGHGNSIYTQMIEPPLTTVRYYYEEGGQEAAAMLLDLMNQEERSTREVRLGYTILERDSTKKTVQVERT